MKRTYEVRDRADKRAIREFLKRDGTCQRQWDTLRD